MKARRTGAGFTLLELLVTTAATVLLAGLVLAVTAGALRAWGRTHGELGVRAEAVAALAMLERDLQAMVRPNGDGVALAVSLEEDSAALERRGWHLAGVRLKPGGTVSDRPWPATAADGEARLAAARFGRGGTWLRFFTVNIEADAGLPVAVSYQVVRRPVSGQPGPGNPAIGRYGLYRSAVTAARSFSLGDDLTAAGYGSSTRTPPATRSGRSIENPAVVDLLAANVVDLGVWVYARDGVGRAQRLFPGADATGRGLGLHPDGADWPAEVGVMIRVLTAQGAAQVAAMESGDVARPAAYADDGEWWWAVVEADSRVFVRRVVIKGGAR